MWAVVIVFHYVASCNN